MNQVHTNRTFEPVADFEKDRNGLPLKAPRTSDGRLAQEQRVRELYVAYQHTNILRHRLIQCYREEGVNHYENCKEIAKEYFDRINSPANGALYAQKQ